MTAITGCGWVVNVTADAASCYVRADSGAASSTTPMNVIGKRGSNPNATVTLIITLKDGGQSSKVTWVGASQLADNPLKATVPINESSLKKVLVKYDGEDCREIFVWPIWANVVIRIAGQISAENKATFLTSNGSFPEAIGGGKDLGTIDKWSNPLLTSLAVRGRMEAIATLSPAGVGEVVPSEKLFFRRKKTTASYTNGGHYVGNTWVAGPDPNQTSMDTDDTSFPVTLDLNPLGNDKLFDIDLPGADVSPAFHTAEVYANFVQYVTITVCGSEELCSNEAKWSYRTCIDVENKKADVNDLKTSHIDVIPPNDPYYKRRIP